MFQGIAATPMPAFARSEEAGASAAREISQ
jgi:hypothetical protein